MTRRVAIVGGGVSGLTTAYRLLSAEEPPEVVVLEAEDRPGGKLRSVEVGGLSLEAGPDSFAARKPWAAALCRELGLGDELVEPATSRAYVWTDRGLVAYPRSAFGVAVDVREFLLWPGLSFGGKLRAARDLLMRPRRDGTDESLGSLVRRRLGDEVADVLVAPLLGGLWAGDADRLSVRATFPELEAWERDFGSLIRGARAAMRGSSGSSAPLFLTLRGGVERLGVALAAAIGTDRIRVGRPVDTIGRAGTAFVLEAGGESIEADAVVLATPAFVAARLVVDLSRDAAASLAPIPYVSTAVAILVYPPGTAGSLPDSSGFVVPHSRAAMTACTFVSGKWPEERFGDRAVVRCFVGAAGSEDVLDASDGDILEAVARQLAGVVVLPERPEAARLVRWERSMPQYEVGHVERVRAASAALPAGIFLTGSAYEGVGIPDCVRGAGETATRVLEHLAGHRRHTETVG